VSPFRRRLEAGGGLLKFALFVNSGTPPDEWWGKKQTEKETKRDKTKGEGPWIVKGNVEQFIGRWG
jgi:hypothetical protein